MTGVYKLFTNCIRNNLRDYSWNNAGYGVDLFCFCLNIPQNFCCHLAPTVDIVASDIIISCKLLLAESSGILLVSLEIGLYPTFTAFTPPVTRFRLGCAFPHFIQLYESLWSRT